MKVLFTGDLHLGHENVIKFDNRPFETVEEMDAELIRRWNNKVDKGDLVYVLGDMIWKARNDDAPGIIKSLNGQIILIKGNHDRFLHNAKAKAALAGIKDYDDICVTLEDGTKRRVILSHYFIPMYIGHAEVRVGNKWFNISPLMRNEDGNVKVQPIISGKSMLHETVEELREDSFMCGRPSDMSEELLSIYNHADDEMVEFYPKGTSYKQYYNQILFAVNYGKSVKSRVKDDQPTRYRGYVSRYSLAAFEIGEIEHFNHWLTQKEYDKLTKDEKKEYTYYEWNDWCDWYGIYAQICKKVDCLLEIFNDWAIYHLKSANLDECTPTADYVRLIVSAE